MVAFDLGRDILLDEYITQIRDLHLAAAGNGGHGRNNKTAQQGPAGNDTQ